MSITSCLARNDLNLPISFVFLVLFNNYFKSDGQYFSKILIHLIVIMSIADVLWLIIWQPYWGSDSDDKNVSWDSISGIHGFVIFLAYLELLVKIGLIAVLFTNYKKNYPDKINELFTISYNSEHNFAKENTQSKITIKSRK
jgi:hypothetical protein